MESSLKSWMEFESILVKEILPIYHHHEQIFDARAIHGRKHIIRSLLFSEVISNYYNSYFSVDLDIIKIRMAISFHDAGRKANGPDFWENESSKICFEYLIGQGYSKSYSSEISRSILKPSLLPETLELQIVRDVDVLEILRIFSGLDQGLNEFREEELSFNSIRNPLLTSLEEIHVNDQRKLLNEAWDFINETESISPHFDNQMEFDQILFCLIRDSKKYPFLNNWFSKSNQLRREL